MGVYEVMVGAAALIMNSEGRILLVKHNYGKYNWELPGGLSEQNESAENKAKREVFEETGLEVTVERLTGVYYEPNHDSITLFSLVRWSTINNPSQMQKK